MSKSFASNTSFFSLVGLGLIGIAAVFLWNRDCGQVDFQVHDANSLVAHDVGATQRVSINIENTTSKPARVVGTNAC